MLPVRIYCSDQPLKDHAATRVAAGRRLEHIEEWGAYELIFDPSSHGFEVIEETHADGTTHSSYEIHWKLHLKANGPNISVHWRVLKPGLRPLDENGNLRDIPESETIPGHIINISNVNINPFAVE